MIAILSILLFSFSVALCAPAAEPLRIGNHTVVVIREKMNLHDTFFKCQSLGMEMLAFPYEDKESTAQTLKLAQEQNLPTFWAYHQDRPDPELVWIHWLTLVNVWDKPYCQIFDMNKRFPWDRVKCSAHYSAVCQSLPPDPPRHFHNDD